MRTSKLFKNASHLLGCWICAAFLLIVLLSHSSTIAAVPQLINYQALLSKPSGAALDTIVDVTFQIWDASIGGNELWSETHSSLVISEGNLSVLLGSITELNESHFMDSAIFMGITVGSDSEIEPRNRVAAVPYAYRLETVDGARAGGLTGTLVITPDLSKAIGEAILIKNQDGDVVFSANVDALGRVYVSLFDPVDSKDGSGRAVEPKITLNKDGIVIHGATAADSNLLLLPDGNITTRGQIAMGENSSGAIWSTVFGYNNTANGDSATVSGGYDNQANGYVSTIGGGHLNIADGYLSTISGGQANSTTGASSTVGGGHHNTASGTSSTVGGGSQNTAGEERSTVSGGDVNTASAPYATVGGGSANQATKFSTTIGGGISNTASDTGATISGGALNACLGIGATIGGGILDSADGFSSTIAGGYSNKTSDSGATISGGKNNIASGKYSTIPGGGLKSVLRQLFFLCRP